MMKLQNVFFTIFTLLSAPSMAGTIHVPYDYRAIQKAILAAKDKDIVLVQPGRYQENIHFAGKAITVISLYHTTRDEQYIPRTVIEADTLGATVEFVGGETSGTRFSGFTVTGGVGRPSRWRARGGGIYSGPTAGPVIDNIILTKNSAAPDIGTEEFLSFTSVSPHADPPTPFSAITSFPNPCNGRTTFRFSLANQQHIKLAVLNSLGEVVATVLDESKGPGQHSVPWEAGQLASGVYFFRLESDSVLSSGKLLLLR